MTTARLHGMGRRLEIDGNAVGRAKSTESEHHLHDGVRWWISRDDRVDLAGEQLVGNYPRSAFPMGYRASSPHWIESGIAVRALPATR